MELANDREHLGWYAEACEYLPQQFSIYRIVRFLQIDEPHVQGNFPLSSEFLQSAHDEQHVDCWSCGTKAALFLREYSPSLAVVAHAGRDDFQQHFACMGNKRNPSIVVAIRVILLFVKDLDDCIFSIAGGLPPLSKR